MSEISGLRTGGPRSDGYTAEVARAFAETVRVLNHATRTPGGLTWPATAYALVGNLAAGAYGLDKLAGQVMTFLDRELAAGRLGEDSGRDPLIAVERARRHLEAAAAAAAALADALTAAQADLCGLHQPGGSEIP